MPTRLARRAPGERRPGAEGDLILSILLWCCICVYGLVVAAWWLRHVLISLARPLGLYVEAVLPPPAAEPDVSVIIPARNERDRIADCVQTLCSHGSRIREIIVVDDRSTDGTGDVVHAAAQGDPRLKLLRVEALAVGWAGKAHACHVGGQSAQGNWLLFADADCRFKPGGIAGAVHYAETQRLEFLTLWLAADHRTFWEHMLIPLCGALILYWFPPLLANRRGTRLAFANGQFILVRRKAYLRIGGHAAARAAVIEDIPLAQHAKACGLDLRAALGPQIASVRMYTRFREIWDGWTRIYIGALQRPWKMLASIVSLLGSSLLPSVAAPVLAVVALMHGFPDGAVERTLMILVWLHFVAVYSVSFRLWAACGCDRRHLWLYPISVVIVAAIFARAWWWLVTGRPIIWRGSFAGAAAGPAGTAAPTTSASSN